MGTLTHSNACDLHRADHDPRGRESRLWLPPARLRRYMLMKCLAAAGFAAIFLGWMLLQWFNPLLRGIAAALALATVWITVRSSLAERRRAAGRQVELLDAALRITTPGRETCLPLAELDHGQWSDDAGLSLHDRDGRPLGLIDTGCIADESEARAFLHWLRDRAGISLRVRWSDHQPNIIHAPTSVITTPPTARARARG
jgi:hypothetical protein